MNSSANSLAPFFCSSSISGLSAHAGNTLTRHIGQRKKTNIDPVKQFLLLVFATSHDRCRNYLQISLSRRNRRAMVQDWRTPSEASSSVRWRKTAFILYLEPQVRRWVSIPLPNHSWNFFVSSVRAFPIVEHSTANHNERVKQTDENSGWSHGSQNVWGAGLVRANLLIATYTCLRNSSSSYWRQHPIRVAFRLQSAPSGKISAHLLNVQVRHSSVDFPQLALIHFTYVMWRPSGTRDYPENNSMEHCIHSFAQTFAWRWWYLSPNIHFQPNFFTCSG